MAAEARGHDADGAAIEARGLTRRFGSLVAVDRVDLTIPRAAIYGFLGPNGSGKSTTIRMLCGLLEPSAGTVRVLGHEMPRDAEQVRSRLGYMTQKFSLWDDLTVHENLQFMARIFGLGRAERERRIAELSDEFELEKLLPQRAGTLSGGQISCCSTSPRARSIRAAAATSGRVSSSSSDAAPPSSCRRTTWTKRSAATGSRSWTVVGWSAKACRRT
jgi:ABC-type nitrate/sulfonate/bicarbonate transport system ATPase subunit